MKVPEPIVIRWEELELSSLEAGDDRFCDFCLGRLRGMVPFIGVTVLLNGPKVMMPGPFGACRDCQRVMGINSGDSIMDLDVLRRFHARVFRAVMKKQGREEKWPLMDPQWVPL